MARDPEFFKHFGSVDDLDRFKAYARQPKRSVTQCHVWLMNELGLVDSKDLPEHPRRVSRSAVGEWMRKFKASDRLFAAAEFASSLHAISKEAGTPDLAGAINLQLAQKLMDQMLQAKSVTADTLAQWSLTVNRIASSQQRVDLLRRKQAEAIREGEAVAKTGATGEQVVARMRELLGAPE